MAGQHQQQYLWQQTVTSIIDRDKYLLQKALWADCVFLVGPDQTTAQRFECHRLNLAKTSPVFAAQLYGALYREGEVIRVVDVTPRAFEKLLKYAYEGSITLTSFDKACELLYAAKKYLMPDYLLCQIRGFVWSRLYPNNVWKGLQFAAANQEPEIYDTAWQIVQYQTTAMLNLQDFLTIPVATLSLLLQQNALACSEVDLFRGCIRWAKEQNLVTQQQAQPGHLPTLRETLEPVVGHIRFLAMTSAEIARGPVKNKILTLEEEQALLVAVAAPEMGVVPEPLCKESNKRADPYNPTFMVLGDPEKDSLNFAVMDTHNFFASFRFIPKNPKQTYLGVRVPTQVKPEGSNTNAYEEELTLLLYDKTNKKLLSETYYNATVNYHQVVDVPYEQPVEVCGSETNLLIKVIFHKSGQYPARNTYDKSGSRLVTGEFGSFANAKIMSFSISKCIHSFAFK